MPITLSILILLEPTYTVFGHRLKHRRNPQLCIVEATSRRLSSLRFVSSLAEGNISPPLGLAALVEGLPTMVTPRPSRFRPAPTACHLLMAADRPHIHRGDGVVEVKCLHMPVGKQPVIHPGGITAGITMVTVDPGRAGDYCVAWGDVGVI